VQAPDGKRYVVRRGDSMGARDGRIIKINSKSIMVREHTRDEDGSIKSTEDIELRLLEKKV
jgi:Tfp pilus assembly protein PilP